MATDTYTVNGAVIAASDAKVTAASDALNATGLFRYTDVTVTTADTGAIISTADGGLTLTNNNVATTAVNNKTLNIASAADVTINSIALKTTESTSTATTENGKLRVTPTITFEDITLSNATMLVGSDTSIILANEAVVTGVDEKSKELYLDAGATVTINNIAGLSATDTAITAVDDDKIKFDFSSDSATTAAMNYADMTFSGGDVTIATDGTITLSTGAIVTNAPERAFEVEAGAVVKINGKTFEADGAVTVNNMADGFAVGDERVYVSGDGDYTLKAAAGNLETVSGISANATVGTTADTLDVITDSEGAFNFGDSTFTIAGDNSVTFGVVSETSVKSVSDLDGTIAGDFTTAVTVDGGRVHVAGDDNISVTATSDSGVTNIDGVSIDRGVTVLGAGGATLVSTNGNGDIQFNNDGRADSTKTQTFTVNDQDSIVSFTTNSKYDNLNSPSVSGVEGLGNGSIIINQDAKDGFKVNDNNLTLSDAASDTPVTLLTANSAITSVGGLTGLINGLTSDATVAMADTDVTINGATFQIDEGADTALDAMVSDGKVTRLTGLNADAVVTTAENVSIATEGNGAFTFPNGTFNIEGDPNGVTFVTDGNSKVKDIRDFVGTLTSDQNEVTVNGAAVYTSNTDASITSAGTGVSAITGIKDGDTVSAPDATAVIVTPETTDTAIVTVNGKEYTLSGDTDGVTIAGSTTPTVSGLDPNAQLLTGAAGMYVVNDTPLQASIGATVVGDPEGSAHVYAPTDITIDENTDTEEVIKQVTGSTEVGEQDKYVQHLDEEETQELVDDIAAGDTSKADGNLELQLSNTDTDTSETQTVDFSNNKGIKKATMKEGNQAISFNNEGGNIAIVSSDATGNKEINLGNGGDVAVIEETDVTTNVKAGRGADNIVSKGRTTNLDLRAGGKTKFMTTGTNRTMNLTGYDYKTGAGMQTTNSDIARAIENNVIELGDGQVGTNGARTIVDNDAPAEGATMMNFYNNKGRKTTVGFTHSAGGTVDMSDFHEDVVMKGNYTKNGATRKSGKSVLKGGNGNVIAFAGAGDDIDAGAGDNSITLYEDRSVSDGGAVVRQTATSGRTNVQGFNFGFGDGNDRISISLSAGVSFKNGQLVFTLGNASLTIDKKTSTSSDAAESSDLATSADTASRIGTENDATNTVSQKVLVGDAENAMRVEVAQAEGVIKVDKINDQITQAYIGDAEKGSGVNVADFEEEVLINLNEGTGHMGNENVYFRDINKLQGGTGINSLMGAASVNNTLVAGVGNTSMWGAGASNDIMIGADSDVKNGSTSFFYMNGDGRDVIDGFEFRTYDNANTADNINTYGSQFTDGEISGDDIIAYMGSDLDRLTLKNARGKNIQVNTGSADWFTAQLNTDSLNYDGIATYLKVTGKNGYLGVNSSLRSAEIWLNNDHDQWISGDSVKQTFVGDIKTLDASNVEGNVTLVGNDNDNIIMAAQGNSSLWGGHNNAGNDTLIGGAGDDRFWYGLNEGDDVIENVDSNDLINVYNIKIEDIESLDVTATQIKATFVGGQSLTINTNNSGVGFKTADSDNTIWTVNQQTRVWSTK